MYLSMRWLRDYVPLDPDLSMRDFCETVTMSGSKVEGWRTEGADLSRVVVGRILSVGPHPGGGRLRIVTVDIGGRDPLSVVTGAENVRAGDLVPVAPEGASVGGAVIGNASFRGVASHGMLCSLRELGLTVHDFPYAAEDGVFVLQEDCRPGQDIRDALGFNDTTVEFEITSNRPDCLSVLGLARETAAAFRLPFSVRKPVVRDCGGDVRDLLSVEVRDPALCPRYMAAVVKNIRVKPSPRWIRERLRASGVRPINNIVDITNFVMLEYGQPMHAFDLGAVRDGHIVVRTAGPGETIRTLDGEDRTLSEGMLVIADADRPVAVAGVMGGAGSGIRGDTDAIVLESACFSGGGVRKTAKRLGMRTESSSRFEKGLDPLNCEDGLERALELIGRLGAGEVVRGRIDVGRPDRSPRTLPFDPDWINRFLGTDLPAGTMAELLRRLSIRVENGRITVPSFRADLEQNADIAEEVARLHGYDRIPTTGLRGCAAGVVTDRQKFTRRIDRALLGLGFDEIITYSFSGPRMFDRIRIPADSPLRRAVVIRNPLGEDTSIMRTTALPSMLETLSRNYNSRNPEAFLYEQAVEYLPDEDAELPLERPVVMIACYGGRSDFFFLKGVVEALFRALGLPAAEYAAVTGCPSFHPGRCAGISIRGRAVGSVGEIHPAVLENFGLGTRAFAARLDTGELYDARLPENRFTPLPRFPASVRDLAVLCDEALPAAAVERAIRDAAGPILERVELFDVYRGDQIPDGKKSIAYSLRLRAPDRTLKVEECDAAVERILARLGELGAGIRQ